MVILAELTAAKESGPYTSLISLSRSATRSSASSQEAGTSWPSFLISGVVRRWSLWMKSLVANRPLMQRAFPLTGLSGFEVTPTTLPSLTQRLKLQPAPQKVQVVLTFLSSKRRPVPPHLFLGQGADRAEGDAVAAEDAVGFRIGDIPEGGHLGVEAAVGEVQDVLAGHFRARPDALAADDALVEVADDEGVVVLQVIVVLLALERAPLDAVQVAVFGELAVAQLLAGQAVQRVVGDQQFENGLPGLDHRRGVGAHHHARRATQVTHDAGRLRMPSISTTHRRQAPTELRPGS